MKKENKLFIIYLGIMIFVSSVVYSCYYEPRVVMKEKETICKQVQLLETYDDSVVLEGRVIYIVTDEYDHPYLKQCVGGDILYIPYTFTDQEEVQIEPTLPIYAKIQSNG